MGLLDKVIKAFHASPHKFDKFSIEHLGKGEGAQVYGNGLYFAEAEPTMQHYYDAFKADSGPLLLNGKPLDVFWNDAIEERWPELFSGRTTADRERLHVVLGNLGMNPASEAHNVIKGLNKWEMGAFDRFVKPHLSEPPPPQAHRYEVEIATDPTKLLDWDKMLMDQPEEVFDAVSPQLKKAYDVVNEQFARRGSDHYWEPTSFEEMPGEEVYNVLSTYRPDGTPALNKKEGFQLAADRLKEVGIDGTKYLDQLSRAAGKGTHNYAIWNDDIISILRRYGIPIGSAVSAGGLLSRLDRGAEA